MKNVDINNFVQRYHGNDLFHRERKTIRVNHAHHAMFEFGRRGSVPLTAAISVFSLTHRSVGLVQLMINDKLAAVELKPRARQTLFRQIKAAMLRASSDTVRAGRDAYMHVLQQIFDVFYVSKFDCDPLRDLVALALTQEQSLTDPVLSHRQMASVIRRIKSDLGDQQRRVLSEDPQLFLEELAKAVEGSSSVAVDLKTPWTAIQQELTELRATVARFCLEPQPQTDQSTVHVYLTGSTNMIPTIREIRALLGVGLKEGVEIYHGVLAGVPYALKKFLPLAAANQIRANFEKAGARIELRPAQAHAPVELRPASFDVYLSSIDPERVLHTIKVVRDVMGLGLFDAKNLVDQLRERGAPPAQVAKGVSEDTVNSIAEQFRAVGATVSLVPV